MEMTYQYVLNERSDVASKWLHILIHKIMLWPNSVEDNQNFIIDYRIEIRLSMNANAIFCTNSWQLTILHVIE